MYHGYLPIPGFIELPMKCIFSHCNVFHNDVEQNIFTLFLNFSYYRLYQSACPRKCSSKLMCKYNEKSDPTMIVDSFQAS